MGEDLFSTLADLIAVVGRLFELWRNEAVLLDAFRCRQTGQEISEGSQGPRARSQTIPIDRNIVDNSK